MKKNGHPAYQDVLFVDTATGKRFVCGSTLQPEDREVFEGTEYPVYKVPVSSDSHPFFTGSNKLVDAEGRVEKFKNRYAPKKQPPKKAAVEVEASKAAEAAAKKAAPKKAAKKAAPKKTAKKKEPKEEG